MHRDGSFFINDYSIGFLGGWGAHPLDILVYGLKDKLSAGYSIQASGKINWPEGSMYNNVNVWDAKLQYENGLKIRFLSQDLAKPLVMKYQSDYRLNGTLFVGTKGWLTLSRTYAESNIPEIHETLNSFPKASYGLHGEKGTHALEFAKLIRGEVIQYMDVDDAILSDTISHSTNAAVRLGTELKWSANDLSFTNSEQANRLVNRPHREPYSV